MTFGNAKSPVALVTAGTAFGAAGLADEHDGRAGTTPPALSLTVPETLPVVILGRGRQRTE